MATPLIYEGAGIPTDGHQSLTSDRILSVQSPSSSSPSPAKVFHTYRRGPFGRKHLFSETGTGAACYYIINPVPQKHANTWRPIFWRGDNPKYCPESTRIAKARRTGFWNSFRIHLGDGIDEVVKNSKRRSKKKWYERRQKWRRWFCMKPTPPKKPLEEEQEVKGLVMALRMYRPRGLGRTLKWEIGGQEYTWKGTRTFLPDQVKKWKGISHDFKLVNSDNIVIATFEKERWASFKASEKVGAPPNKRRTFLGKLQIFPTAYVGVTTAERLTKKEDVLTENMNKVSDKMLQKKTKEDKILNLDGAHSGNLLEEAIVFTCWIAVEGEHRLRWKILDLLEEVAESVGG